MYKVLIDNALMYDPRIDELALISPVVKLEENKAGSFSFKIAANHPFYNSIQRRKSVIQVLQDDEIIFSGMCIEVKTDFYRQKNVYCEGELAYLNDSIQRPARYQRYTVRGLLEAYINNHNMQVDEEKQFSIGMVTVNDSNDSLYCYTNMESTMTALKEDLVDDLGGFFRIRHQNGVKYLDYLADSQNTNTQIIKLGVNLIDYTSNIDSSDIATAIIPLGAILETSAVEGLETRLTIESVNDGLDYVFNQDAVNAYGWIYKTVEWDSVTSASKLKTKGEKYLSEIQFENVVISAQAIDLHFASDEIERFKLSDQIRVVSTSHGLDRYFRLTKQTLNLNAPEKDKITLGKDEKLSLSAQNSQAIESVKKAVDSIVPASTILKQASDNATQLITNAMGGFVYKTNNELYIMDTNDPETATKVWRWNLNGLGYSSNGFNGPYDLAMTMDGTIVSKFLVTGGITADKLDILDAILLRKEGHSGYCTLSANSFDIVSDYDSEKDNTQMSIRFTLSDKLLQKRRSEAAYTSFASNEIEINPENIVFNTKVYDKFTGNMISQDAYKMQAGQGAMSIINSLRDTFYFSFNANNGIYLDIYTYKDANGNICPNIECGSFDEESQNIIYYPIWLGNYENSSGNFAGAGLQASGNGRNLYILSNEKIYCRKGDSNTASHGHTSTYIPIHASAFNVESSKLVKENIKDIEEEHALKILQLRPVTYDYIERVGGKKDQTGFVAEEVYSIYPECVSVPDNYDMEVEHELPTADDDMFDVPSIDYSKFVPDIIKMIQLQQKEIDNLKMELSKRGES